MVIGGVSGGNNNMQPGISGMNMQEDSVSKNLKQQIEMAQKRLQEISSNRDMSMEEKMKKRQEIQQEITSLNQQLRQHQIEQRREQQTAQRQSKGNAMDEVLGDGQHTGSKKADNPGSGLSKAGMQSMISADASMKQAQVQGSVAAKMEGRASVLEAEIKQEKGANSLEAKEEELAETRQKAQEASAAQGSTLASASQEVQEAAKAEQSGQSDEKDSEKEEKSGQAKGEEAAGQENAYTPVDVRL